MEQPHPSTPPTTLDLSSLHLLALQGGGRAELERCLLKEQQQEEQQAPSSPPTAAAPTATTTPSAPSIDAGLPHDPHFTALCIACSYNHLDTARHLLDLGADAKGCPSSYTPFICAAPSLNWRLLALLLARGADPSLLSPNSGSAFDRALDHNFFTATSSSSSSRSGTFDRAAAFMLVAGSPVRRGKDATATAWEVLQRAKKTLATGGRGDDDEAEAWRRAMEAAAAMASRGDEQKPPQQKHKDLVLAARIKELERELGTRIAAAERAAAAAAV